MNNETLVSTLKAVPAIEQRVGAIRLYEANASQSGRVAEIEHAIIAAIETVAYLNGRTLSRSEGLTILTGIIDT